MKQDPKADTVVPVIESGGGEAHLAQAILLYTRNGGNDVTHATLHQVSKNTIQPGALLTLGAAQAVMAGLLGNTASSWQVHDEYVIASAPAGLAWWTPERIVMTHFGESAGVASGEAKHPPMLWMLDGAELYVWALPANERPSMSTQLMHAVQMNVWTGGRVCQGTMNKPKAMARAKWQEAFDLSRYTHPNNGNQWQTSHPDGTVAFWRDRIAAGGAEPYPYQLLVPAGITVEQALNKGTRP